MIYTINIDQSFALEHSLTISEAVMVDYLSRIHTWAELITIGSSQMFWCSRSKVVSELPLVFKTNDNVYRVFKTLEEKGIIIYRKIGDKDAIVLTEEGKTVGRKKIRVLGTDSESSSELIPTYNNTNTDNICHNSKFDQQESLFRDNPEEETKFIKQYPVTIDEAIPKPPPKRGSLADYTQDEQRVYQAYPDKRNGASIKSLKANMKTIKAKLKIYDAETIVRTIEAYISERSRGRIFIENFQTFLNNFDDRFGNLSGSLSKPLPNKAPEEMMNWSGSSASRHIKDFPVRTTNGRLLIRVFYEDGSPLYIGQISTSFKTEVISKSQFNDGIRPDWLVFALNDITEEQLWKI